MKAEIVINIDGLAGLAPAWGRLWRQCPAATPFSHPAWLLPWWRVFAPGRLACVGVWQDAEMVAFAPLYVEDGPYGRRLLPMGIGLSDYCDVLVRPDLMEAAGARLLETIGAMPGWDLWSQEEILPEAAMLALAVPGGWATNHTPQSACPVLSLPAGRDLQGILPQRKWRKWRMAQNRTERRRWELHRAADEATAVSMLDDLFRLHALRWEARGEPGVLAGPLVQAFHRAAVPTLLQAGLLRMRQLLIDGSVAGVYYGVEDETRAYGYLSGFDPAFGFESPGTVLIGAALQEAVADGARAFHFLRGQEAYKYEWGAIDRWNTRLTLRRPA